MQLFNNLKLGVKLPLMLVLVAVTGLAVMGILSYRDASRVLDQGGMEDLQNTLATRKYELENWSRDLLIEASNDAGDMTTQRALREFSAAWGRIEGSPQDYLNNTYGSGSAAPAGKRDTVEYAGDLTDYSIVHRRYHSALRDLRDSKGFADVFLVDVAGNVLYSVAKEPDFTTNLLTGAGAQSPLGKVVAAALTSKTAAPLTSDFASHAPSGGAPAAFIAAPVKSPEGQLLGVIAFQVSKARIEAILRRVQGLGVTGQLYLVGADGLLRSDLRLSPEPALLVRRAEGEASALAFGGKSGVIEAQGMDGAPAHLAFAKVDFLTSVVEQTIEQTKAEVAEHEAAAATLEAVKAEASAVQLAAVGSECESCCCC